MSSYEIVEAYNQLSESDKTEVRDLIKQKRSGSNVVNMNPPVRHTYLEKEGIDNIAKNLIWQFGLLEGSVKFKIEEAMNLTTFGEDKKWDDAVKLRGVLGVISDRIDKLLIEMNMDNKG